MIVSLTRGDTLFRESPDAMMQPASTMKMYTSVLALDRFGPDYQFKTAALRDGQVDSVGTLAGNLYLRGSGDPSLSPRFWGTTNPMDSLARLVVAAGVRHVHGDIVGDASAFDPQFKRELGKDRRTTLSRFRTVQHALEDRERIAKAKSPKPKT